MPSYRLSKLAMQDLIDIAGYGDEKFGIEQSDYYRDKLKKRFSLRAELPMLFHAVDHIQAGYRRSVFDKLSIYCGVHNGCVEIMRIWAGRITNNICPSKNTGYGNTATA